MIQTHDITHLTNQSLIIKLLRKEIFETS